jgi:hypothetical protein
MEMPSLFLSKGFLLMIVDLLQPNDKLSSGAGHGRRLIRVRRGNEPARAG